MDRRVSLVLIAVFTAAVAFAMGFQGAQRNPLWLTTSIPRAYAIDCQPANNTCTNDATKTSALSVDHRSGTPPGATTVVTPNTGEDWDFTVTWVVAPPCNPGESVEENGSFDVDWNGSGWTLSNANLPAHVNNISICDTSFTCASLNPSRSYKVILDVDDNFLHNFGGGNVQVNLQSVDYATDSVDNGLRFTNMLCSTTTAVTPTSQSWGGQDAPGDWTGRCPFNCTVGTGASVTITYN